MCVIGLCSSLSYSQPLVTPRPPHCVQRSVRSLCSRCCPSVLLASLLVVHVVVILCALALAALLS